MKVFINGKIVPKKKAMVSAFDHGFLAGDGIYETMRVYNGRVFDLQEHLRRLSTSARGISLKLPSITYLTSAVNRTVAANPWREAVVRLTVTRGPGLPGFDPALCDSGITVAIIVMPFVPYPATHYTKGIRLAIVGHRRNSPSALPPWVKSTSCLNGILGKMDAIKAKAHEGLFLDEFGRVSEGTVSNIFAVKRGELYTPALGGHLLSGVTRLHVIRIAKRLGIPVHETDINPRFLFSADEVFSTNTTMEVMPVAELINASAIKLPKRRVWTSVGPVSKMLGVAFRLSLVNERR